MNSSQTTRSVSRPGAELISRALANGDALGDLVRSRLRQSSCRFMGRGDGATELWFSPVTGHCFAIPAQLLSRSVARDVLIQAGLEREALPAPASGRPGIRPPGAMSTRRGGSATISPANRN